MKKEEGLQHRWTSEHACNTGGRGPSGSPGPVFCQGPFFKQEGHRTASPVNLHGWSSGTLQGPFPEPSTGSRCLISLPLLRRASGPPSRPWTCRPRHPLRMAWLPSLPRGAASSRATGARPPAAPSTPRPPTRGAPPPRTAASSGSAWPCRTAPSTKASW